MKHKHHNDKSQKEVEEKDVKVDEHLQEPSDCENEQSEKEKSEETQEKDELTTLMEENAKLKDSLLRVMAEYENFRKRTIKEKSDLIKSGGERVLSGFIEIVDDLDLALENMDKSDEIDAVKDGIRLIHSKFVDAMKRQGVAEMPTVGETFDPEKYEAVAMVPTEDPEQKGRIIDCLKKGYTLNDKVIRHPKVVVAN